MERRNNLSVIWTGIGIALVFDAIMGEMEKPVKTPSLLTQTRRQLRQLGLRARKGLAQHFLVDGSILRRITSAAELTPEDIVIEVGPGLGVLTRELAKQAGKVIAVELDDRLAEALKQELASSGNVNVVNADILETEPGALLREHAGKSIEAGASLNYKVVANLPYYITSPVLRHFLEATVKPKIMVVMVQKEVARVIVASPGEMGLLSIAVQLYGRPRIAGYVPGRAFHPPPEVDSAILRIDVYSEPAVPVEEKSFFELVRAGFAAPRKQLANSLAQGLGVAKGEVLPFLEKAGISSQRRAETLSLEEWSRLWQVCNQQRQQDADTSDAS